MEGGGIRLSKARSSASTVRDQIVEAKLGMVPAIYLLPQHLGVRRTASTEASLGYK